MALVCVNVSVCCHFHDFIFDCDISLHNVIFQYYCSVFKKIYHFFRISRLDTIDGTFDLKQNEAAFELCEICTKSVKTRNRHDKRKNRIIKGLNRLKDDPKLLDNINTIQDKWFRRLRSKVYFYLVPIIGLFYFIPAIQFAFLGIEFTLINLLSIFN